MAFPSVYFVNPFEKKESCNVVRLTKVEVNSTHVVSSNSLSFFSRLVFLRKWPSTVKNL